MRHGFKENTAGEALHFFDGLLHLAPVGDGALEPLILFLGKSHADGLAFDFSCPLITRAAGAGPSILGVALTDPADSVKPRLEARRSWPALALFVSS